MTEDDQYLVAKALSAQDTRAFGELVRRHQSQVRNFLRMLSGDPALADDLAQDAFLHAWDKLHSFAGRGSFIGWLMRVAYTTFLQSKRRSKRYAEVLEEAGQAVDASEAGFTRDAHEVHDLDRLLGVLGEEERAIMVMAYACGMSHREISEATGHPVGTVKSLIHRGKERIRASFDIKDYQYG